MLRFQVEGLKDLLVSYDPAASAAYIKVRQGRVSKTKEEAPGVFVDIGAHGQLLGLEILNPKVIGLQIVARIAKTFNVPDLARINPRAIPSIYAHV